MNGSSCGNGVVLHSQLSGERLFTIVNLKQNFGFNFLRSGRVNVVEIVIGFISRSLFALQGQIGHGILGMYLPPS
jgi:hypothetical protein